MKKKKFFDRLKMAGKHFLHGLIPLLFRDSIHSNDDGDPTKAQKEILKTKEDGYSRHLWLNVFLAWNHLLGIEPKKKGSGENVPRENRNNKNISSRLSKKTKNNQRKR